MSEIDFYKTNKKKTQKILKYFQTKFYPEYLAKGDSKRAFGILIFTELK